MSPSPQFRASTDEIVPVVAPVASHPSAPAAPWLFAAVIAGSLLLAAGAGLVLGLLAALETGYAADHWTEVVQAHGRLQMFGWVGVFVLGLSFEFAVRFQQRPPLPVAGRVLVLGALAMGAIFAAVGQLWYDSAGWLWPAGQVIVLAGAIGGLVLLVRVGMPDRLRALDHGWFLAGGVWFVVASVAAASTALAADVSVAAPAESHFAVEVLLRGFVLNIVFGVASRAFVGHLDVPPVSPRRLGLMFVALNGATALWVLGAEPWFLTGVDGLQVAGDLLLAGVVLASTAWLGVFAVRRGFAAGPRYRVLIPIAWVGVVTYALMLVVAASPWWEPAGYDAGAIRHTFLLGFMAPLMLAMAHIVLARFGTGRIRHENWLTAGFVLVAMSAPLRVVPALLSDPPGRAAQGVMGAAAVLAMAGLALAAWVAVETAVDVRGAMRPSARPAARPRGTS